MNCRHVKGEPVTLVPAPVQVQPVQPIQYVVKESQYRPQPQFVDARDANYVQAASGRPVSTGGHGGGDISVN